MTNELNITQSAAMLTNHLLLLLRKPPVFLCIGSDRITGDALGPIVGHMLTAEYDIPAYVYGTLSAPVTALNLNDTLSIIKLKHFNKEIVAIDASVGSLNDLGRIKIYRGSISPGAAGGKKLPSVGDVSITATVDKTNSSLSNVRLGFVYTLAKNIASGINGAFRHNSVSAVNLPTTIL